MPSEELKEYLTKNIFSPLSGYPYGDWMKLLRRHGFRVPPTYWPRALFITLNSLGNSLAIRNEKARYDATIEATEVAPPLFILGHWRSGTTHLHNLLTIDPQFCFPNFYQVTHPHTFLTTEEKASQSKIVKALAPATRLIDNMPASLTAPMEDEVALAMLTGMSPVMGFVFPENRAFFDRYLTFRGVDSAEIAQWKQAFTTYLKKLTIRYQRPIVLKSPPHTCRIKLILDMFPSARFVFIHRNPYVVFQSYKRSSLIMNQMIQLQKPDLARMDSWIIDQYAEFHDAYLKDRALIPAGQLFELSYQSLEDEPMQQLAAIYRTLGLQGFEKASPGFRNYLDSLADYKKSDLPVLGTTVEQQITAHWARYFDEWGYQLNPPA
jgi:hypothetical protein